jgi:NAD-dependent dihydropyrimidine dehydrogenase PreA subunit
MSDTRITVVLSQTRSKDPVKRNLEEEIATSLLLDPSVDFAVVPHVYDLYPEDTGLLYLKSVPGHLVLLSWLYPRAAHWVLDRNGVKGKAGETLLKSLGQESDEDKVGEEEARGIGAGGVPDRQVFCLDLRAYEDPRVYVEEIKRLAREAAVKLVPLTLGLKPETKPLQLPIMPFAPPAGGPPPVIGEVGDRRWYPVIDYTRCTNCMECIDFCLFGVYGLDHSETILVENQDNCRRGCPACSRVCPENAIIFPEHKTPAIAGAPGEGPGALKIDLSKLFGAPNAIEMAALERDTELVRDGRDAVGLTVGIPKRQTGKPAQERDDLDRLMDELDELSL